MPRITHDQKQFYKAKIRRLISIDHGISRRELQERLDSDGLHLDRDYIGKLYDEIIVERGKRMDRQLLNNALSSFEDTMTEIVKVAWDIANSSYLNPQARVMALREIREAHNAVFEKLFDAGVFDRKLGSLEPTIRNTPLPEEKKKAIREVFENWGLLPAPKEDATARKSTPEPFYETYEERRESAKTLLGFSLVYLHGYFTEKPAVFHAELVHSLASRRPPRLLIIGFRGSGKSMFGSLALPLWAALEHPDKYPFIILVADSSRQATLNITSIKHELETNDLIKQDYGEIKGNVIEDFSLQGEGEEWQKQNIVLSNGVRILARSRGQKVRGLRHLQHRPKLVVVDDPEDGEWVRTKENRDKTDRWLHSEIMPGMDARKGKLVVIGNLLHMDALLSRLKAPGTGFKVLEFPLIDKDGKCTWPAMYPTEQKSQGQRTGHGNDPVAAGNVAEDRGGRRRRSSSPRTSIITMSCQANAVASIKGHGIDLAISQKEGADYTAIVTGEVFYVDNAPKIFIRPNPYNEHVTFHDFMQRVRNIPGELKGANLFFVEDVAYQKAAIQEMERAMLPVVPMKPQGDKRARLQVVAPYIKNGTVLFPGAGCEQLLGQIFNLGVEIA